VFIDEYCWYEWLVYAWSTGCASRYDTLLYPFELVGTAPAILEDWKLVPWTGSGLSGNPASLNMLCQYVASASAPAADE